MQPGQARVARGDAIVSFRLQMTKEPGDALGGEITKSYCLNLPAGVLCRVLKQQQHGIAVTVDGVRAHSPLRREIVLKKAE